MNPLSLRSALGAILLLASVSAIRPEAKEVSVGSGLPYASVSSAVNAHLPLAEDLVIYVFMPAGSYSTAETIAPTSAQLNGFKIAVHGVKNAPKISVYVEDQAVYEYDNGIVLSHENILGPNGQEGRLVGGNPYFMVKDHLGSTRVTVDQAGSITEETFYYSYGRMRSLTSSDRPTREKFTTKEFDTEGALANGMNLNYFGARFYDPDVGIWISPDPARFLANPYAYSGGGYNPVNSVDQDGRIPIIIYGAASAGAMVISHPTVQQFAARLPAMMGAASAMARAGTAAATSRAATFLISIQPHLNDKTIVGLGGIYGIMKTVLPDHDFGAAELPDEFSLPFGAGEAGGELLTHTPDIAITIFEGIRGEPGIYNRPINFLPDATATSARTPLQIPGRGTSLSEHRLKMSKD